MRRWRMSYSAGCRSRDLFHHVVRDVEIRMHLLDVIMLVQDLP